MYIENSFIIPQLTPLDKKSAQCVNYSFVKILILRMNIILYLYALHTGTCVRNLLKNTIGAILLSVYKFVQLLSANNVRDICNLGKYIKKAFEKRSVYF